MSGDFVILREDRVSDRESYFKKLSSQMSVLRQTGTFSDVKIQCRNGSVLSHKFLLSGKSKLLKKLFSGCHCFCEDIICQDFSMEAVSKVMELLYMGGLRPDDLSPDLWVEMKDVVRHLQLEMTIPDMETRPAGPLPVVLSPAHESFEANEILDDELKIEESNLSEETFPMETNGQAMVNEVLDLTEEEVIDQNQEGDNFEQHQQKDGFEQLRMEEEEIQIEKVVEMTTSEPAKLLGCPFCIKCFSVKIALKKHLERFHKTNIDILAHGTLKEASKNEDVELRDVRNVEDYVGKPCPKCDELFRIKDLEGHVRDCQIQNDDPVTGTLEKKSPRRVLRDRVPFQAGLKIN